MAKPADLSQFQVKKPEAKVESSNTLLGSTPQKKRRDVERKLKGFRIRVGAAKQLSMLKIETDTDEQDLIAEALNLLFKKYNKPQIA